MIATVAGLSQLATVDGDGIGEPCKIGKDDFYTFWFGMDPKTPMVNWSVSVGTKANAFSGSLTINPDTKEKQKEKEEAKGKEKEAQTPKL